MDIQFKHDKKVFNCRVAGICIKDNKILLSKMKTDNYWTFMGGKPMFGEPTEKAVIREFKEETGVDLEVDRLLSVMENFFEMDGCQWHEYIFFYLLKDTNDFLKVSQEEHTILDHKDVIYKWLGLDDFMKEDIKPYCAKKIIKDLPGQIVHIVNSDI